MSGVIVFALLGAGAAIFACLIRSTCREKHDMKTASGVIEKVVESAGNINYIVSFSADGKMMTGKSVTYPTSTKWLYKGETVSINYYITKAGWPRVIILDDRLESCAESGKGAAKIFWAFSAAFFLVAIIMLVKSLL